MNEPTLKGGKYHQDSVYLLDGTGSKSSCSMQRVGKFTLIDQNLLIPHQKAIVLNFIWSFCLTFEPNK